MDKRPRPQPTTEELARRAEQAIKEAERVREEAQRARDFWELQHRRPGGGES
jgi:hypothetical protein